jgi:hypothetical protein
LENDASDFAALEASSGYAKNGFNLAIQMALIGKTHLISNVSDGELT